MSLSLSVVVDVDWSITGIRKYPVKRLQSLVIGNSPAGSSGRGRVAQNPCRHSVVQTVLSRFRDNISVFEASLDTVPY